MQRHAKNILVYRNDTLQSMFFCKELSLKIYQHGYQSRARQWRKGHAYRSEFAAGNFRISRLMSGNHSGRRVSIKYLPEVCLAYTKAKLVQSRQYTEFGNYRELYYHLDSEEACCMKRLSSNENFF